MATAAQISTWLQRFFDEQQYRYELVGENNTTIKSRFSLDSKLKNVTFFITCRDDGYIVNTTIPLDADEDCRLKVSEYLMRANFGLAFGNFEMDFNDGEIRYRLPVDCEGRTSLPDGVMSKSISLPLRMFDRYGDGLIAVMYGIKSPEEAIKEAEGK